MAFKSLFVGINRYASPLISDLSCSVRDAKALHALFGDAFGTSDSILLVDALATRAAILDALTALQNADPADVVVIGFSGHGSDTHHLITHDADPFQLDSTALHLDELTDLFSRIPARHVILLLDCCFAGGAGAKVFHVPVATKAPVSAEALLQRVSGKGRIIFTAATADQEALEDRRRGHSLFTFFVLEAFRGAPEIVKSGSIPALLAFDFVTRSVADAAKLCRHKQEPTLRGSIDGDFVFPVLEPGELFHSLFPAIGSATVSSRVDDLAVFGFPGPILESLRSAIPSLNALQQEAINKMGVLNGEHVVVSAPTSSGKTMIGELAAL